jgi:hypothetical protein
VQSSEHRSHRRTDCFVDDVGKCSICRNCTYNLKICTNVLKIKNQKEKTIKLTKCQVEKNLSIW